MATSRVEQIYKQSGLNRRVGGHKYTDGETNPILRADNTIRYGSFGQVAKKLCASCGATDRLTVDHKSVSFSRIASKFIAEHGMPRLVNVGNGWQLRDDRQFLEFHDALADYQVLCVSCNSKKGESP